MKYETQFSSEAIKNQRGKVLKENSIIGRSWSSAKLFLVQNYTENANRDASTVENVIFLVSLSSMCAYVLSV